MTALWRRIRRLVFRRRFEAELRDEIAFHVASRARDLEADGLSPAEAVRIAAIRFGRTAAVREDAREVWVIRWLGQLGRDLRLAVRALRRAPGFASVAALTLALGIGGNAALASLLDAALFRPLPFPAPDRLVTLHLRPPASSGEGELFPWSYPKFQTLRRLTRSFDGIAGFTTSNLNVGVGDQTERLVAEQVSAPYFRLLGVQPVLGGDFAPRADSVPGGGGVVILSHRIWERRFGADSSLIGRSVTVHGVPLIVIGIAPRGFAGLSRSADLWVPLTAAAVFDYPEILEESGNHWFDAVARLAPGVSLAAAGGELDLVAAALDRERAEGPAGWAAVVAPLADSRIDPGVRRAIVVLFAAVALVLLIACANLVNLVLARTAGRQREVAVRLAIGAGTRDLVRQLVTESMVIAVVGGGIGVLLARVALPPLLALAPGGGGGLGALVDVHDASIDGRVIVFAAVVTLVAGLLIGLVPALRASRANVAQAFRRGTGWVEGGMARRLGPRRLLVAFETALALILVVGAGLLVRSLIRLQQVDPGFRAANVLSFQVAPADNDLAAQDPVAFRLRLLDEVRALPGVTDAGAGTCAPLSSSCMGSVVRPPAGAPASGPRIPIGVHYVTPGYMETLGIELVEGRPFDDTDRRGAPRRVLVSETAARRIWPGQSALGKELSVYTAYFSGGDSTARVIGVVGDVAYDAREAPPRPQVYAPALQMSFRFGTYFLRTTGDPLALTSAVEAAVRRVDPSLPIYGVRTMAEREALASARSRFATFVLLVFAGLGVTLAAVGVYGVMAYAVANRTREIGIRLALGADPRRLGRLVLREALVTAGGGLIAGLAGAVALTRLLGSLLYEVDPRDPGVLAPAALLLGLVALAAAYLPARRAAATDPMRSIRDGT